VAARDVDDRGGEAREQSAREPGSTLKALFYSRVSPPRPANATHSSGARGGAGDERAALAPGWGESPFDVANYKRPSIAAMIVSMTLSMSVIT
jgi:hypothetical protein